MAWMRVKLNSGNFLRGTIFLQIKLDTPNRLRRCLCGYGSGLRTCFCASKYALYSTAFQPFKRYSFCLTNLCNQLFNVVWKRFVRLWTIDFSSGEMTIILAAYWQYVDWYTVASKLLHDPMSGAARQNYLMGVGWGGVGGCLGVVNWVNSIAKTLILKI